MDEPLLITALLVLFFAVQHSFAISDFFKDQVVRFFGESFYYGYYRLLFTVMNIVILVFLLPYLFQLPDRKLMDYSAWTTVISRILQCLGVWIFIQAGKWFDMLSFIGVRQMIRHMKGQQNKEDEVLVRDGIYARVRHPIYLGSILILWGEPHLMSTQNGIVIVILSTLYFYFGSMFEERRMGRQFAQEYQRYQKEVPRIFPFHWK
jgi:protein-S-isoprenylcysteine O-methyltransferase Ste14